MTSRVRQAVEDLLLFERLDPSAYLWYTRPGGGNISRAPPGRGRVVRPLVEALPDRGGCPLPEPSHHAALVRDPLAPSRRSPRDAFASDGAREHPHDLRPLRASRYLRRGPRYGSDGGGCEMNPDRLTRISCKGEGEGAERIRTAVRGFAGPCLTSRPPRRRGFHRIRRSIRARKT
jgi:hypothetical protein